MYVSTVPAVSALSLVGAPGWQGRAGRGAGGQDLPDYWYADSEQLPEAKTGVPVGREHTSCDWLSCAVFVEHVAKSWSVWYRTQVHSQKNIVKNSIKRKLNECIQAVEKLFLPYV
jgi:hypothetical protein